MSHSAKSNRTNQIMLVSVMIVTVTSLGARLLEVQHTCGSSSSAFADRMLSNRLLICRPVLPATKPDPLLASPLDSQSPGSRQHRAARWYSGRAGSSFSGLSVRAWMRRGSGSYG
jgi:hypothetical protein